VYILPAVETDIRSLTRIRPAWTSWKNQRSQIRISGL